MKVFGSISRLVSILFRKNSNDITFRPNQATTYTASRDVQLPPGDTDHVLVSADSTQTITNKTLTAPTINGGTHTGVTSFSLDDSNSVFNLTLASTSTLTAGRTLTINVNDVARTLSFGGNITTAGDFVTSGANSLTLTTTAATNVTLPTTGTLATLAGTETFTNKTLTSPAINTPTITNATHRGTLLLQNTAGSQPILSLSEDPDNGTDVVNIQAPASLAASYTLTLPVDDGASGEVLSTDGSGVLSWISNASSSSFAATWITADGTTKVVTHNLGSKDVIVQVYDQTDDQTIGVDTVIRTNTNTVTLTSSEAPGAAGWRVLILKI